MEKGPMNEGPIKKLEQSWADCNSPGKEEWRKKPKQFLWSQGTDEEETS